MQEINSVEKLRQEFQAFLKWLETCSKSSTRPRKALIAAASDFRRLKELYDSLFPHDVWDISHQKILELIDKYCEQDKTKCPICSATLRRKKARNGKSFYGCPSYPNCSGSRHISGQVTINDALRRFLSEKIKKNTTWEKQGERFRDLEL